MFNLKLKDIDQTIVNKNIEEQEEEKLKLLSQINRYRIFIGQENQKYKELEKSLLQCKKELDFSKLYKYFLFFLLIKLYVKFLFTKFNNILS